VVEHNGPSVARIDPVANRIAADIPLGPYPRCAVVANGQLWVAESGTGSIAEIDPTSNRVIRDIPVTAKSNSTNLVAAGGMIWVTDYLDGPSSVFRLDPGNGQVTQAVVSGHFSASGEANLLWLADADAGRLLLVNAPSGTVQRTIVTAEPLLIGPGSVQAGILWATGLSSGAVYQVVESTGVATEIVKMGALSAPLATSNKVFFGTSDDRLASLDIASSAQTSIATMALSGTDNSSLCGLAIGFGALWATRFEDQGAIVRIPVQS
jgi:DNA-binding beta-propeller fold protein YncE